MFQAWIPVHGKIVLRAVLDQRHVARRGDLLAPY